MYKVSYFCVFLIIPFVKCNLAGLNIQPGSCPAIQSDPNFNLTAFTSGVWTVSQRSDNLIAGDRDCQNMAFIPIGTGVQVYTIFSNPQTEIARAFQARATPNPRTPGIFQFARSFLGDNFVFKGSFSVPATDNQNYAVIMQCCELMGFRMTTIYVLIKGLTAPPNLNDLVKQGLEKNGLALTPPLVYTNLENRCTATNPLHPILG